MSMNTERIRAYLKEKKIEANPVIGHPLLEQDTYTREMYFMILCAVATYGEVMTENKAAFIRRLLVSVEMTDSLDRYTKMAAGMDEKLFEEFLRVFENGGSTGNRDIRSCLALDLLILLGADGIVNEKQLALVSELLEVLRLAPEEVDFLSRLARSVLEQDDAQYKAVAAKPLKTINMRSLLHYVREFAAGELVNTPEFLYVAAQGSTSYVPPVPGGMVKTFENDEVIFERIRVDLTECGLAFANNRSVKFIECEIEGGEWPISVENLALLSFERCTFRGFTARALQCNNCVELSIENCMFDSCRCEEPYDAKGGVMLLGEVEQFSLISTRFKSCTVSSLKGSYSSGCILYAKSQPKEARVASCSFTACLCLGYNKQNRDGGLFFNIPRELIVQSEFIGVNADLN